MRIDINITSEEIEKIIYGLSLNQDYEFTFDDNNGLELEKAAKNKESLQTAIQDKFPGSVIRGIMGGASTENTINIIIRA